MEIIGEADGGSDMDITDRIHIILITTGIIIIMEIMIFITILLIIFHITDTIDIIMTEITLTANANMQIVHTKEVL